MSEIVSSEWTGVLGRRSGYNYGNRVRCDRSCQEDAELSVLESVNVVSGFNGVDVSDREIVEEVRDWNFCREHAWQMTRKIDAGYLKRAEFVPRLTSYSNIEIGTNDNLSEKQRSCYGYVGYGGDCYRYREYKILQLDLNTMQESYTYACAEHTREILRGGNDRHEDLLARRVIKMYV